MSITNASPLVGGQNSSLRGAVPVTKFTLRDFYVRASISGNSLAAELGRYLNIDETTFTSCVNQLSQLNDSCEDPTVHEQALAAILEVVTTNSNATFEYVRAPEPQGGVQEWWARMLSGSLNNSQSASGSSAIGESL